MKNTFIRYCCFHVHIFWAPWRQCVHLLLLHQPVDQFTCKGRRYLTAPTLDICSTDTSPLFLKFLVLHRSRLFVRPKFSILVLGRKREGRASRALTRSPLASLCLHLLLNELYVTALSARLSVNMNKSEITCKHKQGQRKSLDRAMDKRDTESIIFCSAKSIFFLVRLPLSIRHFLIQCLLGRTRGEGQINQHRLRRVNDIP